MAPVSGITTRFPVCGLKTNRLIVSFLPVKPSTSPTYFCAVPGFSQATVMCGTYSEMLVQLGLLGNSDSGRDLASWLLRCLRRYWRDDDNQCRMEVVMEANEMIPKWADAKLSAELPTICESGESSSIEFKDRFPEQGHRLAQELAALATSGGGAVFVGINNNGEIVGVDAPDADSRDDLVERAQGIVSQVRPVLRVEIVLAIRAGNTVLVLRVPRQSEPVFYYDHRPYIRDGRRSRPATPDEVKERVWSHPSSEHKLEEERIHRERMQTQVDYDRRFAENTSEMDRWFAERR